LLANIANNEHVYWFLFPNFYSTLNRIIKILTTTNNVVILSNLTNLLFQLIMLISLNPDADEEEKQDLYSELIKCLKRILTDGILIDKERLKRAVEKIADKGIR
jgi:adenosyl cobinamide kinase/adenosyl cobinamide phosphate guanylyltransferase